MIFDGGAKVLDLIPPEVKVANSLFWVGLFLRDNRMRALFALRE